MTIEGKSASTKLTMQDMMGLFGRDAESAPVKRGDGELDFRKHGKLLPSTANGDSGAGITSTRGYSSSDTLTKPSNGKDRGRVQPIQRAPRDEGSIFGRRW